MMELILWRHAEAEDGSPDHARELTSKGSKQAAKVASYLHRHLPDHHRILVSPTIRTKQTVSALTHHYTLAPTLAPGASAEAVLHAAQWPDEGGTVLIVGHQPTLGEVASQLLGCADTPLSIKKGAVWWFSQREGSAQVSLRLVITPDML
jgi:phosphohistidine phosphatase